MKDGESGLPRYTYRALSLTGSSTTGTITAPSRRDVIRQLAVSGQSALRVREETVGGIEVLTGVRLWKRRIRLSTFTRQLATLSASGIPLVQGFNVLIEQTEDPHTAQLLTDICESIEGGSTLADAFARHPGLFPRVMLGMIRVGEKGGTLDEVLAQLADLYEKEEALKGEVQAAMAYPSFVLLLGLVSAVLLISFVIPRLRELFEGVGRNLPLPTRILIGMSEAMTTHGWLMLIALVLMGVASWMALKSHKVRLFVDRCTLRIPLLGKLIHIVAIARFSRLLGTLTRGGMPLVEGIEIVQAAVGNRVISEAIGSMSEKIRSGDSMSFVMKGTQVFPPLPVQMVAVGEETGCIDQMFLRIAEAYEREATRKTRTITSLLAPALILCVAIVVGFILLSMLLPIFQLSSLMK